VIIFYCSLCFIYTKEKREGEKGKRGSEKEGMVRKRVSREGREKGDTYT
jgi:hypothetical protein